MKLTNYLCLVIIVLFAIAGCKKNNPVALTNNADVYAVGYIAINNPSNNSVVYTAACWKNGVATFLPNSLLYYPAPISVAIHGNDVYIAGEYVANNGNFVACCWKNGVITKLTDSTTSSMANAIALEGNDVYIGGCIQGNTPVNYRLACYWKNGLLNKVVDTVTNESQANAIAVQGNDVYLAGIRFPAYTSMFTGVYWKNGTVINLSNNLPISQANGIAVSGSDIFVTGSNSSAIYWKNNVVVPITFSFPQIGNAIALQGSDVYMAGNTSANPNSSDYVAIASYWKNGVLTQLSDATQYSNALAIAIQGSDVYVAGDDMAKITAIGYAAYWKNGTLVQISNQHSCLYGIAVVPH